jgi:hypothetical protein
MQWQQFAEWVYMTYGTCRITTLEELGRPYITDVVKEGDLWYFPAALPHSLQGLGPDGCQFVICFDEGKARSRRIARAGTRRIPAIDAVFLAELEDNESNPLKSKGIGELGICGAGASIANAIYNARGARIRDYPITLDKLLAELPAQA